jgi:FdhE protein
MGAVFFEGARAARALRLAACVPSAMPEYMQSLNLLQKVLDFQEALATRITPLFTFSHEQALAKWQEEQALFAGETLGFSVELFGEALQELHELLAAEEPVRTACQALLASSWHTPQGLSDLLPRLLQERESFVIQQAQELDVEAAVLGAVLRTLFSPYFAREAAPYRAWIEESHWRRGFCPICGSWPGMARLAQKDGRRILACCLCHSEWEFDRLRCPFCESTGKPQLRHFTVGGDEVHRIECCEHCKAYLKTVDERKLGHRANLIIEDMITAHLDARAQAERYH